MLGDAAAEAVLRLRTAPARRLEANLERIAPAAGPAARRRRLRAALRASARYYTETLRLHCWSRERLAARTEVRGASRITAALASGRPVVVALPHSGNWDQAGAWAAQHLAPVLTVAERIRPAALHEAFVAHRADLGITVLPLAARTYPALRARQAPGTLTCLLTDRAIGTPGLAVTLGGREARFGAAPARLAVDTGAALFAATLHRERLADAADPTDTTRRRAAGSRDVLVVEVSEELVCEEFASGPAASRGNRPAASRREATAALTQRVADVFAPALASAPHEWHMLQPVFADDLAGPP